jgi:hypothetical protein
VKAYWDETLVNETKEVSWGALYPGASSNVTFYLQSVSNVQTKFELSYGKWTFLDSTGATIMGPVDSTSYLVLEWDYDNSTVMPREKLQVTLTLNVTKSSDFVLFLVNSDVSEFRVDINIRAIEQ